MSPAEYYQSKLIGCNREIQTIRQRLYGLSLVRLATFIGTAGLIYGLTQQPSLPLGVAALALFAGFIISLNRYYHWRDERDLWEKLRFLTQNEIDGLAGGTNSFPDGNDWLDSENYLDDLDIFGRRSIFHTLNRTTTVRGRNTLANRLRQPLLNPEEIVNVQHAIRILAPQADTRQLLTAHGLLRANKDKEYDLPTRGLQDWLNARPLLYRRPLRLILLVLLIGFNCTAIATWIVSNNYTLVLIGVLISRLVLILTAKYTHRQHEHIDHKQNLLEQAAAILAVFNTADAGDSTLLQQLKARTGNAHTAIRRLASLANYFDHRMNNLVNIFINTFVLYDLLCVLALERWKAAGRAGFLDGLEAIGAVEELNSLATYAFNHPDHNYPSPSTENTPLFIETTQVAHPLIPAGRRIANDITIGREQRLILVTGSNMSGKTTFLRTLGVNLLMAQCGLPVCAHTFRFTPMDILTSLRISDSLEEQTSYFMAELKKLQRIIHRLQTGAPALVLIDEILRGTNSEDKTFGSEQFIKQLLQYNCLSFFATHDLSLGSLEQAGAITNYCFESVIENDELHFNYLLQRGIARNRNASFLMKKMDII